MKKELIIHSDKNRLEIALLEDGLLMELHREEAKVSCCAGDIYLGRVHKVMAGLNAVFVNIGSEKDAFLHYLDLGVNFKTLKKLAKQAGQKRQPVDISAMKRQEELSKNGNIKNELSPGDAVIVQVVKEPISTKGPRLTTDLSIPGRHLVLIPFGDKVSVSQKIRQNAEKKRLKRIVDDILPNNFGVIVRTAAEGKSDEDIASDLRELLQKWKTIMVTMQANSRETILLGEDNKVTQILRDLLNDSFSAIHTDSEIVYNQVRKYIAEVEPDAERIVKLYHGKLPIFDNFDITKQIKQQFGRTVPYKHGAYLIVEHTEALHVIDVNSGRRTKNDENQEANALEVNLNAVEAIARQLRLKDMGGIIVIDFIDLNDAHHRTILYKAMCKAMENDRAKHNVLPLSKFCLMQITRQRIRPETHIVIEEQCPYCNGTGHIAPTILVEQRLYDTIKYLANEKHYKSLTLHVHPYVAAYLSKGFLSIRRKWAWEFHIVLRILPNENMGIVEFNFYSASGDIIH